MEEANDLRAVRCDRFNKAPLVTRHVDATLARGCGNVVMKSDFHRAAKIWWRRDGNEATILGCLRRATTTRLATRPYTNQVAVLVREEIAHMCIAIETKPTKMPSAQIYPLRVSRIAATPPKTSKLRRKIVNGIAPARPVSARSDK